MPRTDEEREAAITEFGEGIFQSLQGRTPSIFQKQYWSERMMEWSMRDPELKANMFRLIDVLPTLKTIPAIAQHISEYLSSVTHRYHPLLGWAFRIPPRSLRALIASGIVRLSVAQMASQFIAGETPQKAVPKLLRLRRQSFAFTADLLGEYSLSEEEAENYLRRYLEALDVFGKKILFQKEASPLFSDHPGEQSPISISVKLTALYSQCSPLNEKDSVRILGERLAQITRKAKALGALLYVDAEDSSSNSIIYTTFMEVFLREEFLDFPYPGIVLQAYNKSSESQLIEFLDFAKKRAAPIAIRLVKGAYWDSETILSAQQQLPSPVFSKKAQSDANFERLSRILLDHHELVLPAFASHNIRSLAHACSYAEEKGLGPSSFELQMLYGMAEPIAMAFAKKGYLVRLYVPLGEMIPGMGYLVRRLLENTSNESFLRHTFFDEREIASLLKAPSFRMTEQETQDSEKESSLSSGK